MSATGVYGWISFKSELKTCYGDFHHDGGLGVLVEAPIGVMVLTHHSKVTLLSSNVE